MMKKNLQEVMEDNNIKCHFSEEFHADDGAGHNGGEGSPVSNHYEVKEGDAHE